jgi:hypothetical protein
LFISFFNVYKFSKENLCPRRRGGRKCRKGGRGAIGNYYLHRKLLFTHAGEEAEKAVEALETMKLHFTRQVTLLGNLSRTQGETEAEGEGALEGSQESGALMCP